MTPPKDTPARQFMSNRWCCRIPCTDSRTRFSPSVSRRIDRRVHPQTPRPAPSLRPHWLSCRTSLPPGVEAAEHAPKDITHRHVLPPSCRNGGATQIGSKRTFQIKLGNGLALSRVTTTFAVPRSLDRIRADSNRFSLLWVGRKAHANSGVIHFKALPTVPLTYPVLTRIGS